MEFLRCIFQLGVTVRQSETIIPNWKIKILTFVCPFNDVLFCYFIYSKVPNKRTCTICNLKLVIWGLFEDIFRSFLGPFWGHFYVIFEGILRAFLCHFWCHFWGHFWGLFEVIFEVICGNLRSFKAFISKVYVRLLGTSRWLYSSLVLFFPSTLPCGLINLLEVTRGII